jgi:hypothetical protein
MDAANLRACVTSEDRQNAFYNVALFYSATNQLDYMESALRNAMRYAPNWYKPHWLLAQLLSHTGHYSSDRADQPLNERGARAGRTERS